MTIQDENLPSSKTVQTLQDIIKDIQAEDPSYVPKCNIHTLRPLPPGDLINPMTFTQITQNQPSPIVYVASPIIPTQGICFIYAATGIGKTLFTLNLAYAIAQGGRFLKYECPRPRKLLYIDGEMSYNDLHARIMTISRHHGELDYEENFSVLTPDKVYPYKIPKIDEEEGQSLYVKLINKFNYEVIVFDNISMLTSIDENKSESWSKLQDWFLHLRAMGKTTIVIHHSGKDKNGYRGSSRMLDCANTAISLQPVVDEGLEEENVTAKKFKVVYQKHRSFGGKEALPYEVILEKELWSYQSVEKTNLDRVVEKLHSGMSQRDIAREMGIAQSYVHKLISKARKLGLTLK